MGFPQDSISQRTETVGCIFPHTEVNLIFPPTLLPQLYSPQQSTAAVALPQSLSCRQHGACTVLEEPVSLVLQAKIEDPETGEIAALNSPGELQIRGYCVMLGYWEDPVKTNEVIADDRWYKTG